MTTSYSPGNIYHGFRLIEERFVREINASCLHFSHVKSGARLLKVMADDPNKTFCIGFKTLPSSDNGAPHILEHAVLNGSQNFPVKSPFDVLLKGSLSTFLNAFTSKDYTMYPVASMNDTDYFNLVHVYLDAVFNPLIYSDPRILKQEGWHLELAGRDKPLGYTGVVYNEMKGSFSNPQRVLWYEVFRHLFPDNPYGFESGGTPVAIPTLTHEQFLDFHRTYYHPENSYIFLYGNADPDKELAFLNGEYLSKYEKTGNEPLLPDQQPFISMKEVTAFYPVLESAGTENQTYLTYNVVAGQNTDLALTMALDILCEVLVNQETAPLRHALLEAGIGQDVSASSSNFKQHAVQIAALNANPGDRQRFLEIIMQTLERVIREGLDKQDIEGVINRMEFRMREGDDAQKGLTYLNMALPRWFFAGDPIAGLEYEKPLSEVKKALTTDYLEKILSQYFMGNPHALLLSLEPRPGLEKEQHAQTEKELEGIRAGLDDSALDRLVQETDDLIAHQQREDTPEALASVPMLAISDIEPRAVFHRVTPMEMQGIPVLWHEEFTNGVVYVNLLFDMTTLPEEWVPYGSLLANLLGSLPTENYTFGDLNRQLNLHTGGFFPALRSYLSRSNDNLLLPRFTVATKAMHHKAGQMFNLVAEVTGRTVFSDTGRLRTVLSRHQSQLESQVKGNGFHVASRRLASYISRSGRFGELTAGLSYYHFITGLLKGFDTGHEHLTATLEEVSRLLFSQGNLVLALTCSREDLEKLSAPAEALAGSLATVVPVHREWALAPVGKNEGLMAASNVQYVVKGFNYKNLGYSWNGRLRVLGQVLSTDWLQTRIRVVGGAYGGFSSISPGGNFTFNSYRDPNLAATLEAYDGTPEYLAGFTADSSVMTRYIIGTIAEMDTPLTPSQKGDQAVSLYLTGRTEEEVQRDRNDVLSATAQDIRDFSGLVGDVLRQGTFCVYGAQERLEAESSLFSSLVSIAPDRG